MSIYDEQSSNPLERYADLPDLKELFETVRTVTVSGRNWKYYRLEIVRRYRENSGSRPYDYTALVYVEDVLDVERTLDDETFYPGQTRIFTRWTNFPEISKDDADTALHEALRLLLERVNR
ncbi:MAG: hypothetical protein ACOCTG_02090 [Bacteroidota bacterium]